MNDRLNTLRKVFTKYYVPITFGIVAVAMASFVSSRSIIGGAFALAAILCSAFSGIMWHYISSEQPPISVEDHVFHVIENTLTELSAECETMTPLNISRRVAEELMYENLISVEDYESTKLAILGQFAPSQQSGSFQGKQIITSVAPYIRG